VSSTQQNKKIPDPCFKKIKTRGGTEIFHAHSEASTRKLSVTGPQSLHRKKEKIKKRGGAENFHTHSEASM
jgi:hypothetical protein